MAGCLGLNSGHLHEDRYEGINPQVWNHDSRESVSDVTISTADGVNELSAKPEVRAAASTRMGKVWTRCGPGREKAWQ